MLESLASQGILNKEFFDRFLLCPQCRSANLRPTTYCPKCGSGNITRGRVLEHLICGYVGLEDEFLARGTLICPKCKAELRKQESDYRSLGLMRKCQVCGDVFPTAVPPSITLAICTSFRRCIPNPGPRSRARTLTPLSISSARQVARQLR